MTAVNAGIRAMLIVAQEYSDLTVSFLTRREIQAKIHAIAVKIQPAQASVQAADLEDMAMLTGGRPLLRIAGQTLRGVKLEDLGQARSVWADKTNFGLSRGKGDARRLRAHIAGLRAAYRQTDDADTQANLLARIGKLMGGSATLWVGGAAESEIKARKALAERAAQALRGAVRDGVVPGGGMALLACRPLLQQRLDQSADPDERAAYRILRQAVETPLRTLLHNAGYEPSEMMSRLYRAGPEHGFDVTTGQMVNMAQAGLYDVATAQKEAARAAISSAALALTIDVLVHRREIVVAQSP